MGIGVVSEMRALGVTERYKLERQVMAGVFQVAQITLRLVVHSSLPYAGHSPGFLLIHVLESISPFVLHRATGNQCERSSSCGSVVD
jgi:hypothetical protein